jgi:hypothetical protein
MFSFFKDKKFRGYFYRTIGFSIIGAMIALFRMVGRHGHLDEMYLYIFVGILIFCFFVAVFLLDKNYKKSLLKRK